jgi:hypothetical protein
VLPREAPSQLHLTQFRIGGCQITSLILGAFPNFNLTWNFLRRTNSEIFEYALRRETFPDIETAAIIRLMRDFQ